MRRSLSLVHLILGALPVFGVYGQKTFANQCLLSFKAPSSVIAQQFFKDADLDSHPNSQLHFRAGKYRAAIEQIVSPLNGSVEPETRSRVVAALNAFLSRTDMQLSPLQAQNVTEGSGLSQFPNLEIVLARPSDFMAAVRTASALTAELGGDPLQTPIPALQEVYREIHSRVSQLDPRQMNESARNMYHRVLADLSKMNPHAPAHLAMSGVARNFTILSTTIESGRSWSMESDPNLSWWAAHAELALNFPVGVIIPTFRELSYEDFNSRAHEFIFMAQVTSRSRFVDRRFMPSDDLFGHDLHHGQWEFIYANRDLSSWFPGFLQSLRQSRSSARIKLVAEVILFEMTHEVGLSIANSYDIPLVRTPTSVREALQNGQFLAITVPMWMRYRERHEFEGDPEIGSANELLQASSLLHNLARRYFRNLN